VAEIAAYPLVVPKLGHTRDALDALFYDHKLKPNLAMELDSSELLKRFVAAGVGIGFIARSNIEEDIRAKALVAITFADAQIRRDLAIVFRKDKSHSRAARAFMEIAVKQKNFSTIAPENDRNEAACLFPAFLVFAPAVSQRSKAIRRQSDCRRQQADRSKNNRHVALYRQRDSRRQRPPHRPTRRRWRFQGGYTTPRNSGLFRDLSYTYSASAAGVKLELQLADTDPSKLVPARFETSSGLPMTNF